MNAGAKFTTAFLIWVAGAAFAADSAQPTISGDYLEVRSCDVFVGACFANGEMGVEGKEATMVWRVREGSWNSVPLAGLSVIAVVRTDDTMGDLRYNPRSGPAMLIVDSKASPAQSSALADMARSFAGDLIEKVVKIERSPIQVAINGAADKGVASVKAGKLVEIATRDFVHLDLLCSHEEAFYPPLTPVQSAYPAFTKRTTFRGDALNVTWEDMTANSAFIGVFSR